MIRLLLIDDEPRVARALEFAVTGLDVEVTVISAPVNITEQVLAATPDAILLDIGLVGADGLDLCRQLTQDIRVSAIPIVILSGQTDAKTRTASFAAGADDFIPKPFVPIELMARIKAQLARRTGR